MIHKHNGGQGSARNIGLDQAKGDLVTFVDSDDAVSKDTYSSNMSFFDDDKIDLVQYPCIIKYGTDFPVTKYVNNCTISGTENLFKSWLKDNDISNYVCNKIFRRSFFESLRFPEGMYFEDRYLMSEILEKCNMAYLSDKGMYYYYQRSNQVTSKPDSVFVLESKIKADLNIVKHTVHFKSLRSQYIERYYNCLFYLDKIKRFGWTLSKDVLYDLKSNIPSFKIILLSKAPLGIKVNLLRILIKGL